MAAQDLAAVRVTAKQPAAAEAELRRATESLQQVGL